MYEFCIFVSVLRPADRSAGSSAPIFQKIKKACPAPPHGDGHTNTASSVAQATPRHHSQPYSVVSLHVDLRCQFRNFIDVFLNRIERQSGTGIVTTPELSPQLLERLAIRFALGQSKIHVFCYQLGFSALVSDVVSIVRFDRLS